MTEKAEPNGIDILLGFEQGEDIIGFQADDYNEPYQAGVQRHSEPLIDLHVIEDSKAGLERWRRFFQRDRDGVFVGLVEVVL